MENRRQRLPVFLELTNQQRQRNRAEGAAPPGATLHLTVLEQFNKEGKNEMGTNCIKPVGYVVTDTGLHSVACKMRNCPVCSQINRLMLMDRVKYFFKSDDRLRFMTLTKSIHDQTDIMKHWNTLLTDIKRKFPGIKGFWVKEYTKKGVAHLHVIVDRYIPQEWLKERWLGITCTSYIVHVEEMDDINNPAGYMLKYMTKAHASDYRKGERIYGFFRGSCSTQRTLRLRPPRTRFYAGPALEPDIEVLARLRRQERLAARRLLHRVAKASRPGLYRVHGVKNP